ncbi:prolyl 4-hydroxylase subunit alpha-1-like [Choristoneura fumiferana]|uniref:prolyl 4-hydroxylase subunit alpha-1-like n=1 Tax=Choristoneura fumiferana TaxID=7141 RepID=UPI003D15B27C
MSNSIRLSKMLSNILYTAVNLFLLCMLQAWTNAEFYSAIAQMEPLLETQKQIIEGLDKYVTREKKRIAVLTSHLQVHKAEYERAMEDIPDYLGDPVNVFKLIKRLTIDLAEIDYNIIVGAANIRNMAVKREDLKYPTTDDLAGAAQALTRLQNIYRLDVRDLADGVLSGFQGRPLTAADCFDITRTLYNNTDYNNTLAWSMEALRKFKEESNIEHTMTESEIMEYIIFSHFYIGDVKSALEWSNKLLELDPDHPEARNNILRFEETIKEQEQENRTEKKQSSDVEMISYSTKLKYNALCRDEKKIPSEITKRLRCRYLMEHHPFLRLAPIKVEQVYIQPDVYVFHEVISDEEIESIKNLSLPRLQRALVERETGKREKAYYRVSQSAWVNSTESEAIARLSWRVADMTGLSMQSAEPLQVGNYGIGGQYDPHYDFSQFQDFSEGVGNRIATVMFYMSDVALGGATVFTELGLSVFPIKHAALFWMNLLPSGEGDRATLHAGCPVLRGSKWVAINWLHEVGQELLKPCSLDYQEEKN